MLLGQHLSDAQPCVLLGCGVPVSGGATAAGFGVSGSLALAVVVFYLGGTCLPSAQSVQLMWSACWCECVHDLGVTSVCGDMAVLWRRSLVVCLVSWAGGGW